MQNDPALNELFERFRDRFRVYAGTFAEPDATFFVPIERKIEHTYDVCSVTEALCERTSPPFSEETKFLFRTAALFHDVSRFEQFRRFGTFRDTISFDHGARSAELLTEQNFTPELSSAQCAVVETAIRVHNKFAIPTDLPDAVLPAVKMLRDADKLGILALVLDFFTNPAREPDRTMKLDLPDTPGFTRPLLQTILSGTSIHHKDMRNVNDFILSLFAWVNDYHFSASSAFALENHYYPRLHALLPSEPAMDDLLSYAETTLRRNAAGGVPV